MPILLLCKCYNPRINQSFKKLIIKSIHFILLIFSCKLQIPVLLIFLFFKKSNSSKNETFFQKCIITQKLEIMNTIVILGMIILSFIFFTSLASANTSKKDQECDF